MSATSSVATAVTVPAQSGPPDHETLPALDHVTMHSIRCYWDFTVCGWVCRD